MGSQAARLADWDAALAVGRRVAGPGSPRRGVGARSDAGGLRGADPVRRGADHRVHLARPERVPIPLVGDVQDRVDPREPRRAPTDARTAGGPDPGEGLRHRHGPAQGARRPGRGRSSATSRRRVLGQYDAFLPPDDEGLLYFVGPNVAEVEQRFLLPPRDFRLWIAVHEVTHRVQFGAAPWLRDHIRGQVDRYLGTVSLESNDLGKQIRRAIDEARAGADVRGMGGLFLLLNDEQREIVRHVQGVMSLLEGHASFVMNEVAKDHVSDLAADADGARRAAAARGRGRAFVPARDRLRQEDRAVRRGRAVRPRGRVSLRGWRVQPRVARAPKGSPPWTRSPSPPPGSPASPGADMPRRPPAVARVLERVTKTAREHEMFQPGDLVLVSCSGGPGLGVPALLAVASPATVQDPARGLPLRPQAPGRFGEGRRVRADRLADRLAAPVPSPDGGRWTTERRVRGSVGVGGADARGRRRPRRGGRATDRGRPHARRPGRDGAAQPDPWDRSRGARGDRPAVARPSTGSSSRCSTSPATRWKRSAVRSVCVLAATR